MNERLTTLEILKTVYQITGARISLHDLNFREIAAYPANIHPFCKQVQKDAKGYYNCTCADTFAFHKVREIGKPYTYKCHCGLFEAVAPIYNYGVLSGYFMMGQLRHNDPSEELMIQKQSDAFFKDKDSVLEMIQTIPKTNNEQIESYFRILVIIAEYMTQTNRLSDSIGDLAESVKSYIQRFYSSKISVDSMCEHFMCSRTTLMNVFRKKYGMTIGNYLTQYRLEKSREMLKKSSKSIKAVASECGFSDQNYFTKVFVKHYGVTPSDFRAEKDTVQKI
jgi:AraC-like DNA-binding protein